MNEDEAFIRAIVDNPGNDLPRLVYADWLDDRDDPRGPYMRAECEAVETGDIARLRELATGLDPVWVARVSMPPVGACITHTEVSNRGPSVSTADIATYEQRIGVHFPDDYKAFLLNYNGGYINGSRCFDTPDGPRTGQEREWWFNPIHCVGQFTLRHDDTFAIDLAERLELPPLTEPIEHWLLRYVVIGHDPDLIGSIFLSVSGADRGCVRIIDTSVELESGIRYSAVDHTPYARNFSECLERIFGFDEPSASSTQIENESDDEPIPF